MTARGLAVAGLLLIGTALVLGAIAASAREPDSWEAARVIDEGRGGGNYPAMAVDADGNAVAAWQGYNVSSGDEQTSVRAYVAGQGWGPITALSTSDAVYARSPDAVFVEPGRATVGGMAGQPRARLSRKEATSRR